MKNSPRHHGSDGFTLIELLIVTAILGVLAIFASHALVGFASRVVDSSDAAVAVASPELSQAAKLVRLAGLAILLFGGGFWYTVELRRPGRLDEFRLGHFLLLALTFSLFFVVFAVLDAYELSAWMAAGIAALVSYPLVVAHVSTITGWRFGIFTALPLAALTTGIAVNGVYGGDLRAIIFVGMLVLVVTYLTWTYPRMSRTHDQLLKQREADLTRRTDALTELTNALRAEITRSHTMLRREDTIECQGLRRWLEQRHDDAARTINDYETLIGTHNRMKFATTRSGRKEQCQRGFDLAIALSQKMPQAEAALTKAMQSLASHREMTELPVEATRDEHHCVACGHSTTTDSRYCGNCGRQSAERRECHRCAHVLLLPVHLMREDCRPGAAQGFTPVTHCQSCGERHAVADQAG